MAKYQFKIELAVREDAEPLDDRKPPTIDEVAEAIRADLEIEFDEYVVKVYAGERSDTD